MVWLLSFLWWWLCCCRFFFVVFFVLDPCLIMQYFVSFVFMQSWGSGSGVGVPLSNIPFIINMANIPKIQKALYPRIPKIDPSIPYPFKYLQNYPVSLYVLANIPVSIKTFPGPQSSHWEGRAGCSTVIIFLAAMWLILLFASSLRYHGWQCVVCHFLSLINAFDISVLLFLKKCIHFWKVHGIMNT